MLTKQQRTSIIKLWKETLDLPAGSTYNNYVKKAKMDAIRSTVKALNCEIVISAEGWVVRPIKKGASA